MLVLAALLSAFMFALYPLCVAHVNDHVDEGEFVEASSGMLLLQGSGAVAGPILAAMLMGWFGSAALFVFTAAVHGLLMVFVFSRLRRKARPSAADRGDFILMPTSATAGLDLDPRAVELEPADQDQGADGSPDRNETT